MACTLNADQEASLHKAMTKYINGYNDGEVAAYVAYTYPNAVAYYKTQGDSLFKEKYSLSAEFNRPFLQDGTILEIESDKGVIHVKYEFMSIGFNDNLDPVAEEIIYAISEDDGNSWFFLDEKDYNNDEIIEKNKRLITTK